MDDEISFPESRSADITHRPKFTTKASHVEMPACLVCSRFLFHSRQIINRQKTIMSVVSGLQAEIIANALRYDVSGSRVGDVFLLFFLL